MSRVTSATCDERSYKEGCLYRRIRTIGKMHPTLALKKSEKIQNDLTDDGG